MQSRMTANESNSSLSSFYSLLNVPANTVNYTLSLHDALPISIAYQRVPSLRRSLSRNAGGMRGQSRAVMDRRDRKSTRLNSSHTVISYAVFCLKKKKKYN